MKPVRSLEFPAANIFKDKIITILSKLNNKNYITAIIIDLSSVNLIDYTCMMTLSHILSESKPLNQFKGTIIYITGYNEKIIKQLKKFNLLDIDNLSHLHGEWLIKYYKTNNEIMNIINDNMNNIEKKFPYDWMTPNYSNTLNNGEIILGKDNKYWKFTILDDKKFWERYNYNFLSSQNLIISHV